MELRLKAGWSDYFISGAVVGALASLLYFIYSFQEEVKMDVWTILGILALVSFSIFAFVMGCRVKRKSQV